MSYNPINHLWGKMMAFTEIFNDDNRWNEKTVIGFMSFAVMTMYSIVDLGTGLFGMDLPLHEYIYNSFLYLTIGSFGIAGLEKFSPTERAKVNNTSEEP